MLEPRAGLRSTLVLCPNLGALGCLSRELVLGCSIQSLASWAGLGSAAFARRRMLTPSDRLEAA